MGELMKERIEKLREAKQKAALGGGPEKIDKVHQKGKLTARERLDRLLDPGSFTDLGMLVGYMQGSPGDGMVYGYGTIDGRPICIYSQDATVQGGSIGMLHGYKMYRTVERAMDMRVPVIGIHDSPGARQVRLTGETEMPEAMVVEEKGGGSVFYINTQASGVIPQIAVIAGACAGISVYSPALMDFVFMVDKTSQMFITGPRVVKSVIGEDITMEDLGGAEVHTAISGVADLRTETEDGCFEKVRKLLSYLPSSCDELPPIVDTGDDPYRLIPELEDIVPDDPDIPYDVHELITRLVDNGDFFEIKPEFAGEIVVGFARLAGQTVGIVASQPSIYGGALTVDSSCKQARFIRTCDCFNIPIIVLIDTSAYAPGSDQEHAGIIRHGAKNLFALCEATVPRIAVITRKSYGGGNLGLGVVPGMATDFVFAWPIAEWGVMGAKESVRLFFGAEILKAENPEQFLTEKVKWYRDSFANPLVFGSRASIYEDIIEPKETRKVLARALNILKGKKMTRVPKKHGNIPL